MTTRASVVVFIVFASKCERLFNGCMEHTNELNDRRAENHDVQRREQKEHERKDQLDPDLGRTLLGALPTLGSRGFRVRPQRLRDARAELVRLHEQRDERSHVVHLGARREVLERLEPGLSGADLGGDQPELVRQRGIRDVQFI